MTLPPGTYDVRVNKDGRLFGSPDPASLNVVAGANAQDFTLPAPGRLRVTVTDETGAPSPAKVQLVGFDASPDPLNTQDVLGALTNRTGVFGEEFEDGWRRLTFAPTRHQYRPAGSRGVCRGMARWGFGWATFAEGEAPVSPGRRHLLESSAASVAVPWWVLALGFAIAPARAAWRWRKGRRRPGHACVGCGYDLRATPDPRDCTSPACRARAAAKVCARGAESCGRQTLRMASRLRLECASPKPHPQQERRGTAATAAVTAVTWAKRTMQRDAGSWAAGCA
jgi:hypothetical protein